MRIHLINPSDLSFGMGVITPRWLYMLANAMPRSYGDPMVADETLEPFDAAKAGPGDVVGIAIHTSNALRGHEVGRLIHERDHLAGSASRCSRREPCRTCGFRSKPRAPER